MGKWEEPPRKGFSWNKINQGRINLNAYLIANVGLIKDERRTQPLGFLFVRRNG